MEEQQRAKSYGQLYEQIWSNNNTNNQPSQPMPGQLAMLNQINRQNFHSNQQTIDDINLKQLEINSNNNRINTQNCQQQHQQQISQQIPIHHQPLRNYENQQVNSTSRVPPAVMAKPSLPPNKPSQVRFNRNNNINSATAMTTTTSNSSSNILNNRDSNSNQNDDEIMRLQMLKKRIEMLNELEAKAYRTNDEENMLNKLRTEIEFDKRVIEMNTMNMSQQYMDEINEENDVLEYAPEVRERMANEILQRRKKFDEILNDNNNININVNGNGQEMEYLQQRQNQYQQNNIGENRPKSIKCCYTIFYLNLRFPFLYLYKR
jgi:hypothetical protein